ncbi:MAG: SRPBCC domain-containing protein [Hamadaea sp.]|nr:SRPBCC domain-containing protein [Hamadaea sp.]
MTAVYLTRHLPAAPEKVWAALTRPEALATWFWPQRMTVTALADARPAGSFRIEAATPPMAVSGFYIEVTPPQRLVFTWRWDGETSESLVTITLTARDGGTTLDLVHERLADAEVADHDQGWRDCLDRLPAFL